MHTEQLSYLVEESTQKGHEMAFYHNEYVYTTAQDHPFIQESFDSFHMAYPPLNRDFYKNSPVYQSVLFCEHTDEAYYAQSYPHFDFVRWHERAVDVLPKGCSKAKGIEQFLERAGFKKENTFAFGDGKNDLQMLSYVGTGVAMGNAVSELKQCADIVTSSCDEDGIMKGLQEAGLLK
jgi:Cof subfamily protein (haloacid dehalogenase superfamily)